MSWIFTSLKSGPLPSDNYQWDITGLSANTIYAYRAYVVIDGIVYTGETFTGITSVIPTYPPSGVTTGNATGITATSFNITGSSVGWKGIVPIEEYGIIYTQNPIWGTEANLIYENVANFSKVSILGDIGEGDLFNNIITSLTPGTMTYFRAFAKNASGIGYGEIKTTTTASLDSDVYFNPTILSGNIAVLDGTNTLGKTFSITFDYNIDAACDLIGVTGTNQATTTIEISTDGGVTWTEIDLVTAYCENDVDFGEASDNQTKTGTHTINGITDLTMVKWRGYYDCSGTQWGQSGGLTIQIFNATANSGNVNIPPDKNAFTAGCGFLPYVS